MRFARSFTPFLAVALWGIAALEARAQTPACDALAPQARQTAQELLRELHPYDCCDQTLAKCLAAKPRCPLVVRLANDVCRRVAASEPRGKIETALSQRALSMVPSGKQAAIEVDETMAIGDRAAPVTLVVYACTRCPYCKVVVRALYEKVTTGALAGKVRLHFRPFPIKGHAGSKEGGLALVAASRLGKFWPMLLHVYEQYDRFCPGLLAEWAASLGMDRAAFEREMAADHTVQALVSSKREGIRNGVNATPTLFVNGRKYVYDTSTEALVDALTEEYERVRGEGKRAANRRGP